MEDTWFERCAMRQHKAQIMTLRHETHLVTSGQVDDSEQSGRTPLLNLPWEIRSRILEQLLVHDEPLWGYRRRLTNEYGEFTCPSTGNFKFYPQILQCCTQLRDDGYELLYGSNVFGVKLHTTPQPFAGVLGYPFLSSWETPQDQVNCRISLTKRVRNYDVCVLTESELDSQRIREAVEQFCGAINRRSADRLRVRIEMAPYDEFPFYHPPDWAARLLPPEWRPLLYRMRSLVQAHEGFQAFQSLNIRELELPSLPEPLVTRLRDVIQNQASPFSTAELGDIVMKEFLNGEREEGLYRYQPDLTGGEQLEKLFMQIYHLF